MEIVKGTILDGNGRGNQGLNGLRATKMVMRGSKDGLWVKGTKNGYCQSV